MRERGHQVSLGDAGTVSWRTPLIFTVAQRAQRSVLITVKMKRWQEEFPQRAPAALSQPEDMVRRSAIAVGLFAAACLAFICLVKCYSPSQKPQLLIQCIGFLAVRLSARSVTYQTQSSALWSLSPSKFLCSSPCWFLLAWLFLPAVQGGDWR